MTAQGLIDTTEMYLRTIFELEEGAFEFVDNFKNKRTAHQKLTAQTVIAAGKRLTSD